jgi:hypothetical protein
MAKKDFLVEEMIELVHEEFCAWPNFPRPIRSVLEEAYGSSLRLSVSLRTATRAPSATMRFNLYKSTSLILTKFTVNIINVYVFN